MTASVGLSVACARKGRRAMSSAIGAVASPNQHAAHTQQAPVDTSELRSGAATGQAACSP
jgi:hypothetical protein